MKVMAAEMALVDCIVPRLFNFIEAATAAIGGHAVRRDDGNSIRVNRNAGIVKAVFSRDLQQISISRDERPDAPRSTVSFGRPVARRDDLATPAELAHFDSRIDRIQKCVRWA
jgi:hypothetical protein